MFVSCFFLVAFSMLHAIYMYVVVHELYFPRQWMTSFFLNSLFNVSATVTSQLVCSCCFLCHRLCFHVYDVELRRFIYLDDVTDVVE